MTAQPITAQFSAAMLRWVAPAMAPKDIRPYLHGITVEQAPQGGVFLVASDGHMILVAHDPDGRTNARFILTPSKAAIAACAAEPKSLSKAKANLAEVSGTRLTLVRDELRTVSRRHDPDAARSEIYIQPGSCVLPEPWSNLSYDGGLWSWQKVFNTQVCANDPAPAISISAEMLERALSGLPLRNKLNDLVISHKSNKVVFAMNSLAGHSFSGAIMEKRDHYGRDYANALQACTSFLPAPRPDRPRRPAHR